MFKEIFLESVTVDNKAIYFIEFKAQLIISIPWIWIFDNSICQKNLTNILSTLNTNLAFLSKISIQRQT